MEIPVGIVKVFPELVTTVWPLELVEGRLGVLEVVETSDIVLLPGSSSDCDGDGVNVKV